MIDEYYNYKLGNLEYRTLRFENEILEDVDNYQGVAVMNFNSHDEKYTRIIEHKHFECMNPDEIDKTVITREYPKTWKAGDEPWR